MELDKTNAGQGISVAGLVIGIISLFFAFVPCIGIFAFFPGAIAVILSVVGWIQASNGNGRTAMPVVATIISGLAIIVAVVWGVLLAKFVSEEGDFRDVIEQVRTEIEHEIGEDLHIAIEEAADELEDVEINIKVKKGDGKDLEMSEDELNSMEEKLKELEEDDSVEKDDKK